MNPDWNREELILALNLYFKMDYGQMHGRNPDVIQLSKDLRNLYIHSNIPDKEKFRSVNSVALKLANLKKSDQNFKGKGMRDGGKLEKEIWNEFHRHRDTLKNEADLIRQLYLKPKSENKSVTAEPKVNYKSDFLYLFHKNRETDPLVNKVKKEMVLTNSKSLKCEVCGFDSVAFYGELGNDLMEIHYKKESKNEPGLESSSMEDFIIVCSNCHKALDKNFGLLNADDLKKIIRKR
jgi:5-methylcytosine-specific restriction protein A